MLQQHFLTLTKDFTTHENVFQEKAALNQSCLRYLHIFSLQDMSKKKKFLKIISSSHAMVYRHLSRIFCEVMQDITQYQTAIFDAESGRIIDDEIVTSMKNNMDWLDGKSKEFVLVIILGSNNLRRNVQLTDILRCYEEILAHASQLSTRVNTGYKNC